MTHLILRTLAIALCTFATAPAWAQQAQPMIMDGKDSLFQRVLVRERVTRRDSPGAAEGPTVAPLQALYVYQRQDDWIEVALGDQGDDRFWLPTSAVSDWNQNIVATMEANSELPQLLFFSDLDALYDVVESEAPGIVAKDLRDAASAAQESGEPSDPIVALGPREVIDQRSNLYVMPILSAEEAIFEIGPDVNLLTVAVARADAGGSGTPSIEAPINAPDHIREDFKAAVVFVVDTTISMDRYIKGTRDALTAVYQEVNSSAAAGAVSFGLIGFRDNLRAAPDLEYDVKTFVNLQDGFSSDAFLAGIGEMTEATASSRNFREDSFRGVDYALDALDWSDFDARFIVVVTDASPRLDTDEFSATGLSAIGLANVSRERRNAVISVFHLRTDQGERDHAGAEAVYRELTRRPSGPPLYFPVENGSPEIYRDTARQLSQIIVEQVGGFRSGDDVIEDFAEDDGGSGDNATFGALRSAGRTMQLAFLGRTEGTKAPDVFDAAVADRDFERFGLKPLSIRVLVTKAELSNLDEALKIIIEQSEANLIDPDQFFGQVLGAAADMSRRPDKVSRQSDPSLAEAVAIDEYIEDLPYKSRIMGITEDDWLRMPFSEQIDVTNELYEKRERYRRYNESTDQWVDYLGTGATGASLLYPMPLDDLP